MSNILDRLSFQVSELQEGFNTLSESTNINELGQKFCHIVRGNFLTTKITLLYKDKNNDSWEDLYNGNFCDNDELKAKPHTEMHISFNEESDAKAIAVLPFKDTSAFLLALGQKLNKENYSEFEKILFQIYLQVLSNSYQAFQNRLKEKELIFSLNHRVLQLNSLIDTGIEISKFQKSEILFEMALERAASLTSSSAARLIIFDGETVMKKMIFPEYRDDLIEAEKDLIKSEFEFDKQKYELSIIEKESRQGVVPFDETDKLLLDSITQQVKVALENEFLHKESIEKENMKKELSVAASIQQMIIPKELPEILGYDLAGINIPSKEVGGDYYDVIKLNDGRYALIIADVTGKGIPAALLVSTLNASLGAFLQSDIPVDDLTAKLNKIVYKASPSDKFITFFISILDPETGGLDIVNAGHNPSLVLKEDGTIKKIDAGGVALGMFDMGLPFAGEKYILQKGERLLMFTDGIPEAMNEEEEEYSDERLEEYFITNKPGSAQPFVDMIVKDVKEYAGSAPQSDDITCIYLIRK